MLTTTQKAPILLGETNQTITGGQYAATSSDPAVASVGDGGGYFAVFGNAAGTATITVTRNADGASASMDVEVTSAAPFTIILGAPVSK